MHIHNSKQSEKEYLSRTASEEWERFKPFTPPGNYSDESLDLIQDFVVAVKALKLTPSDLILDLGAGSCWVSEWLRRLNLRTVSVDIALDMLKIGKDRLSESSQPAAVVTGDIENLPFQTGSFDKALCLNAFHHVPDNQKGLKEIFRVLKKDGAVLFSEPGKGHADHPQSKAAVRDFGVLEQEILISKFMDACFNAGFEDVRLKPISYSIPEFDLTRNEWRSWEIFWLRKRPIRALQKIWRDVLEFCGLGKKGLLLEETFAVNMIRLLKEPVEHHPIIVASKTILERADVPKYRANIQILNAVNQIRPGRNVELSVRIENKGNVTWPSASPDSLAIVQAGVQLLDEQQMLLTKDYFRKPLPKDMAPADRNAMQLDFPAPDHPGIYYLKLDMVLEGVTWFELKGSAPALHRLEVIS